MNITPSDGPSSLLPETNLVVWTTAHAVAAATVTLQALRAANVRVSPANRLERALRLVDQVGALVADDSPSVRRRLEEAHRTIVEQYLIVMALGPQRSARRETLQQLVAGPDVPDGRANTTAHDYQFELFVETLLLLGGVGGVHVGEPDVRIQVGAGAIGIAVKRVSSRRQLTRRVREAIDQSKRSGLPSFVVALLDWPDRPSDADRLGHAVETLFAEHLPTLEAATAQSGILGAFFFSMAWSWTEEGPRALAGMTIYRRGHLFAGDAAPAIIQIVNTIGRNIHRELVSAVQQLDAEARRLVVKEQIALARDRPDQRRGRTPPPVDGEPSA